MTRCPEYYQKWEKDPNWCNLCASSVSQIESYIDLVNRLEEAGAPRKFTYVKLSENHSRDFRHHLKKSNDDDQKTIIKRVADVIKNPDSKKVTPAQLNDFSLYRPIPVGIVRIPSTESLIKRTLREIEYHKLRLAGLERYLLELQETPSPDAEPDIVEDFIACIDRMLLQIHQGLDITEHDDKAKAINTVNVVGLDAVKERLAKTTGVGPS